MNEEVDVGLPAWCSVAGVVGVGRRRGRIRVRMEVESFFEAWEIATGLDELVEEIIVSRWIREEGITGRRRECECGEEGREESWEVWVLR